MDTFLVSTATNCAGLGGALTVAVGGNASGCRWIDGEVRGVVGLGCRRRPGRGRPVERMVVEGRMPAGGAANAPTEDESFAEGSLPDSFWTVDGGVALRPSAGPEPPVSVTSSRSRRSRG